MQDLLPERILGSETTFQQNKDGKQIGKENRVSVSAAPTNSLSAATRSQKLWEQHQSEELRSREGWVSAGRQSRLWG